MSHHNGEMSLTAGDWATIAGALGAVVWAATNVWPYGFSQGVGVVATDAALLATGIAVMMRQQPAPTAALCLGLMMSKALLLTLIARGTPVPMSVMSALTILILLYMAGSLIAQRVWILVIGAIVAAVLTGLGPPIAGADGRALWFLGMALWLYSGISMGCVCHARRV